METILVLLIVAVLNGAVAFIDGMLSDLVPMTLHADRYMTGVGGGSMVDGLFEILLGFGVFLIVLARPAPSAKAGAAPRPWRW